MTQLTLSRRMRTKLQGLTFDQDKMCVGRYPVVNVMDAYTADSTPERPKVARSYLRLVVEIGTPGGPSRLVELLGCTLCLRRVATTVAMIENHIRYEHTNGDRLVHAADPIAPIATTDTTEETPMPPTTPTPEPVDDTAVAQDAPPQDAPPQRRGPGAATMQRARETRARYDALIAKQGPMKVTHAARELGVHRDVLSKRLRLTEGMTPPATPSGRRRYNNDSPQDTYDRFHAMAAADGTLPTLKDAAARLGMTPATLRKRLDQVADEAAGTPSVPQDEAAGTPLPAPRQPDDDPEIVGVIDDDEETRLDRSLAAVAQARVWMDQIGLVAASRNEWRQRATDAERKAAEIAAERDELARRLTAIQDLAR